MATIQEVLAATRQPRKTPFVGLLEGVARGFGQAQTAAPEQTRLLALMEHERAAAEQDRAERERAAEIDRQVRAQLAAATEDKTKAGLAAVGGDKKPALPGLRLTGAAVGKHGYIEPKFEVVTPTEPKAPDEPKTFEALLVGEVRAGKMTLEDALKKAATERGGGASAAPSPALAYQMERDKKKAAEDLQELQVPGYSIGEGVRPTSTEAKGLREATAQMNTFIGGVDRLMELIRENGSTELTGTTSGEMSSLASNLKLSLKEVQKLGVLSASDIAFLDAQIFDPSKLSSLATTTPTAIKQLETTKARAEKALADGLRARGYVPNAPAAPAPPPPAGDDIALTGPKAERLRALRAAAAARAAGGRPK